MEQLLEQEFGTTDPRLIARAIYNSTACGAWITIDGNTLQLGSIVEGSDVDIIADPLIWPFTAEDLWNTLEWIEAEAEAAWIEANEE